MTNEAKASINMIIGDDGVAETLKGEYGLEFNEFHINEFTSHTLYKAPEIHPQPYICDLKISKISSTKRTSEKVVAKRRKKNKNRKTHRG